MKQRLYLPSTVAGWPPGQHALFPCLTQVNILLGPAVVLHVRVISSPLLSVTFGAIEIVTKSSGETKKRQRQRSGNNDIDLEI